MIDLSVVINLFNFGFPIVYYDLLAVKAVFFWYVNHEIVYSRFNETRIYVDIIFVFLKRSELWLIYALRTFVIQQVFANDLSPVKQLIFK